MWRMRLALLTFFLLFSGACSANPPVLMAFWAGWGNPPIEVGGQTPILGDGTSAIDFLSLAFVIPRLSGTTPIFDTTASGNFLVPDTAAFKIINAYRNRFPNTKILLDIGGITGATFFYSTDFTNHVTDFAQGLVLLVESNNYAGVALDPEYRYVRGITADQIKTADANMLKFVAALRAAMPSKYILYDVGTTINYYTELLSHPDFVNSINYFDLMAYNSGVGVATGTEYQTILQTWEKYVGKDKLILGVQPSDMGLIMTPSIFKSKADWVASNGYAGVFMFALSPELYNSSYSFFLYLQSLYGGSHHWQ